MKYIRIIFAALLTLAAFASCQKESNIAKAVMVSESYLTCPAQDAPDCSVKVYADADWVCDAPEWITVSPATGTGTMDVTLSFADNMRDGAVDNPRKDTVIFHGATLASRAFLVVQQEGDKFRDLQQKNLTEISAEPVEAFVYAKESQVVAVTTNGFVAADEAAVMFVESKTVPVVGDKVTFYGYVGEINGMKAVVNCERLTVASNSAVTYPAENNVTATFDSYASTTMEYIALDGVYEKGQLKVNDATTMNCLVYNPAESLGLSGMDGHKLTLKGYHAGTVGSTVYIIVVQVVDNGVDEIIYFSDDFEWIAPMAAKDGAGDSVGTDNASATAPNVWKMTSSQEFFDKFNEIGYQYLYSKVGSTEFEAGPAQAPNGSVSKDGSMYIQKNYLKFGQTSYSGALRLPALTAIQGTANVIIEFDWCWQVTGSNNPDLMTISVDATVGQFVATGSTTSAPQESAQSQTNGQSHLAWQHVTIELNGATAETVLTIRPTNADPDVQNSARHQNRWYLDNIKVVQGEGGDAPVGGSSVLAVFPFPDDQTFTGEGEGAGTMWNLEEGWLLSEDGKSKLSSHKADGSSLKFTYKYEASSDEGLTKNHVRVLATGMVKDDFWIFEVPVKDMPAGTYNVTYKHSASATGPNYFLLEVSLDGQTWAPVAAQTTTEAFVDGTSPREVTWTYALNRGGVNAANIAYVVNVEYAAPALPGDNTLYLRARISDDMAYGSTKALGTKGTNRIWGPCEISFAY